MKMLLNSSEILSNENLYKNKKCLSSEKEASHFKTFHFLVWLMRTNRSHTSTHTPALDVSRVDNHWIRSEDSSVDVWEGNTDEMIMLTVPLLALIINHDSITHKQSSPSILRAIQQSFKILHLFPASLFSSICSPSRTSPYPRVDSPWKRTHQFSIRG